MPIELNMDGWDQTLKSIVNNHLSPGAEAIADACNDDSGVPDGYRAGTEGDPKKQLKKRSYRATVITATEDAMKDNAVNNRLVNNFHLGSI